MKRINFKGKGNFSKKVVVFMLLFLFSFTVANMILFYLTGNEPSTLIGFVFGFCGAEGWITAHLKNTERKIEAQKMESDIYEQ